MLKFFNKRLNLNDEAELLALYRETIATEKMGDFKSQANSLILRKIIEEV